MQKEIVRDFIVRVDDAANNRMSDPYALLDENVQVLINGTTALSGLFTGFNIIRNVLISTARRRIENASVRLIDCIGSGDRVAALLLITAVTVDGRTYNEKADPAGCIFSICDGKIYRIHLYADTHLIETVIFNQTMVPG